MMMLYRCFVKSLWIVILLIVAVGVNVQVATAAVPVIEEVDPKVISVIGRDTFKTELYFRSDHLTYMYDVRINSHVKTSDVVRFGSAWIPYVWRSADDRKLIEVTVEIDPKQYQTKHARRFHFFKDGKLVAVSEKVRILDPKYQRKKTGNVADFFRNTNARMASKRTIGLNVHRALSADSNVTDVVFQKNLASSDTIWVREFVAYDALIGEHRKQWIRRYDQAFDHYRRENKRVVAMLAYGSGAGDQKFIPPNTTDWQAFVRLVVTRWGNTIDAYEIWNEPDLAKYMKPNTVDALVPLLKASYSTIKTHDPNSYVLNGGIGNIRTTTFIRELYAKGGDYFDELSIHAYYCGEYLRDGNLQALQRDIVHVQQAIPTHRQADGIWVTELGCSMGMSGVNAQVQQRALAEMTKLFLNTGKVRVMMLYHIRNRPDQDVYEANFGLLDDADRPKLAWNWYANLPNE